MPTLSNQPATESGSLNPRMSGDSNAAPLRVLYSFPHKLGAGRISYTAWEQVNGISAAGAQVTAMPGMLQREVSEGVKVRTTLSVGKLRLPYKLLGSDRTFALHDRIVARRLKSMADRIDVVHVWPMGAMHTMKMAARLGIPTVLERPNAHTRFAYEVVRAECERIGVPLPADHEHAFNQSRLDHEEREYELADFLLCPSEFVARTFRDRGFSPSKLLRHSYGFSEGRFSPDTQPRDPQRGLRMISVGVCAVRKGIHIALEAWLKSTACKKGKFQIVGDFLPAYREKLAPLLAHPSVEVLGHRNDIPELMRRSDILVLASLEEGSALVTSEGRASGCVLAVSDASGANCEHMKNALVHPAGSVSVLAQHLDILDSDRVLLDQLRAESLRTVNEITWLAAGKKLVQAYHQAVQSKACR